MTLEVILYNDYLCCFDGMKERVSANGIQEV